MARIRTLKPEILEDEKVAALSDPAYRLFTGMIVLADDHGNVRADARWLLGQIWWSRESPPRVAEILREVSGAQLVDLYMVRGGVYAHLRGWSKHQRIDNAGKPRVPGPRDRDAEPFGEHEGDSPKVSAKRREIPLDPDPERDPDPEMSGKPDLAALMAQAAVGEINRLAGKSYKPETSLKLCRALVKAKRTPEQAVQVVQSKRAWIGDAKMGQFFRPATLLAAENFAKYLDDLEAGSGPERTLVSSPDRPEAVSPLMLSFDEEELDAAS